MFELVLLPWGVCIQVTNEALRKGLKPIAGDKIQLAIYPQRVDYISSQSAY
jgi:hypothetical protein